MTTLQYTHRTDQPVGVIADSSEAFFAGHESEALNNMVFMVNDHGVETLITPEMIESKLSELRDAC